MVLATIRRHENRRFLPGFSSPPSPRRLHLPPSTMRPYPPRLHVLFLLLLLLFSPPFLPSSERRQVGVRAAVNSPAPLSALMSLLLFALLNAIRAYSVSLPPLLGPRATTSSFRLLRANVVIHAQMRSHTRARSSILAATLSRSRGLRTGTRTRTQHADAHGRARNALVSRRGDGGGIAISHRHASAHYCVISRTKTPP